ncbi:protein-glutamate O-methyltransferase CheR [Pseudoalteromonas carrageenovora]|jgi:chemotaxis protein methyltransferase CheR|uniref:CheR family methyltransferase n=1 Tax=Pseudoalteromonas TaxID=53246 RepID=UPI000731F13A|nr:MULTISPECIES: protein-glutamate O-methyltransferase CheR [Pseudoalteromonas]KTF15027.1 chemotaxis protein CheR [Pseudoalteromonas sp. H103]MCQ8891385.1 protein-glutamate O-methyltransferase CheR [Pseudoalteromonas carrageenovora]MDO6636877.1 protein-glutamate O-methyltransferase CheR [Pseudoalteromonas carrageenovora]MDO6649093.1 protein-glutamate O-methyltransferase CheR [Pseudoalteromonas carrageenovora]TMP03938.1 protein-glutamate O-methyltransferase CheR [Pseudoalteromonas sp. S3178]|tara:strand:- start:294 stop:1124 length:831 start_codon:yes stop_codon:yes gene_type:complete
MKEFLFTERDFKEIAALVYNACGIVLGEHKREMVYSRIARRIRERKLTDFSTYLAYLNSHKDQEFDAFINALTTNLTSFFRESHHFDYLKKQLVPALLVQNKNSRRVRIWSAGCSTGEEPYSLAMALHELFPSNWDVKILATDLDSNVLKKAHTGVYSAANVNGLDDALLKRWFLKSKDGESYKVKPKLQQLISFKRLNLLQDWPMKGPFDLILCRNVVIYFDKDTKDLLFKRYAKILAPHGHLFLGHSETMGKEHTEFKNLGKTMYQKAADARTV